jgi:isocitrate dehydrogenase (NAD+)
MESLKVTTKKSSARLIEYAFEFAHLSGRKKITVIHKANIMYFRNIIVQEAG